MSVQGYPMLLSIYKGEGRILIIPVINHVAGYSIVSDWFINIRDTEEEVNIGNEIIHAIDFIKGSPCSTLTPQEREQMAAWKKNTRYKSKISFWKNNHFARLKFYEAGHYEIFSMTKSEERKGGYSENIKEISLPSGATAEELGKAVMEVMAASEEYYKDKPAPSTYPSKRIELLDGSMLTVEYPHDRHFVDSEDCHAAEVYQCYSYLPQEDAEATAEFFLGMASELDCNLNKENVLQVWEEIYGKADSFQMQEINHGIFKLRGEIKNKAVHKVSYFLAMEEDLLLECSMEIHQPNKRKKLDESLGDLFVRFTLSCKM